MLAFSSKHCRASQSSYSTTVVDSYAEFVTSNSPQVIFKGSWWHKAARGRLSLSLSDALSIKVEPASFFSSALKQSSGFVSLFSVPFSPTIPAPLRRSLTNILNSAWHSICELLIDGTASGEASAVLLWNATPVFLTSQRRFYGFHQKAPGAKTLEAVDPT